MSENSKNILSREAKVLEYWRRRYLMQAVVVIVLALGIAAAAVMSGGIIAAKILFLLIIAFVAYLMIKELRNSLQTRGEGLIFANAKTLFPKLEFDYGRGLDENNPALQNALPPYGVRECRSVVSGRGFILEEDWCYTVVSSRFIPVNQTVFEGIILNIDCPQNAEASARRPEITQTAEKLRRILGTPKLRIVPSEKQIAFYFSGDKKIFYQFSLIRPNTVSSFLRRIEQLQNLIAEITSPLR